MKIICVGKNYAEHVKEFDNVMPTEPVIFTKPDSALVRPNFPFFYPEFSNNIHFEVELVIRINKVGKNIAEKFAHKYYHEMAIGIDFTARDIQLRAKENGLPWALSKGFDGSAPLSEFREISSYGELNDIRFSLQQNGELRQSGHSVDMLFSVDKIIAYVSSFMTLKKGDLIFTGTPSGVGPIAIDDKLEAFIGEEKLLEVRVK